MRLELIDSIGDRSAFSVVLGVGGGPSFAGGYAAALLHEFRLLIKVHRERGFSIIQACKTPHPNSPAALPFRPIYKRFIFDQYDLGPELFLAKYGDKGFLIGRSSFFERCSYAMADFVVTANATFKDIAVRRGGKAPSRVQVVTRCPRQEHPSRSTGPWIERRAQSRARLSRRHWRSGRRRSSGARGRRAGPVRGFRDFWRDCRRRPRVELVARWRCSSASRIISLTGYLSGDSPARAYQRLRHRRSSPIRSTRQTT